VPGRDMIASSIDAVRRVVLVPLSLDWLARSTVLGECPDYYKKIAGIVCDSLESFRSRARNAGVIASTWGSRGLLLEYAYNFVDLAESELGRTLLQSQILLELLREETREEAQKDSRPPPRRPHLQPRKDQG